MENDHDMISPWPHGCKLYKTSNACNRFEMYEDGSGIYSCDIAEACMAAVEEPECLEYYDWIESENTYDKPGDQCSSSWVPAV